MAFSARSIVSGALLAASAAGMAYTVFAIARLRQFQKARPAAPQRMPRVTILKPLHGDEAGLYENLRSFCDQDYDEFDVVFGASDPEDPALAAARRLQAEFPARRIRVAAGAPGAARNPKVANLLGMQTAITGELIVIADSDMCVHRTYLKDLASLFDDPKTGAATCVFSGTPNESAVSRVGAMAITDEFCPSVLVAAALAPVDFCMGATVALRRSIFDAFGGFEAIADCLADDYEIAQRVKGLGYDIALAPFAPATAVPERHLRDLWKHEVRWARTVFRARPAGYAGTIVLHYVPLSALAVLVSGGSAASVAIFVAAGALRAWLHKQAHATLAPHVRTALHLLPLRIVLSLGVWGAAFSGHRVGWRGEEYAVNAKGRLVNGPGEL